MLIIAAASRDFRVGRLERLHALPSGGTQNGSATTRQAAHRRVQQVSCFDQTVRAHVARFGERQYRRETNSTHVPCAGTPPVPVQACLTGYYARNRCAAAIDEYCIASPSTRLRRPHQPPSSVAAHASTAFRRPTSVTIAKRPSHGARVGVNKQVIWVERKQKYFCRQGRTGQITQAALASEFTSAFSGAADMAGLAAVSTGSRWTRNGHERNSLRLWQLRDGSCRAETQLQHDHSCGPDRFSSRSARNTLA